MAVDPNDFKAAAGSFGSGVTVVTSKLGGRVHGMTVSAFASLSLDPMQIMVSLRTGSRLQQMMQESQVFAVSILREDQQAAAAHFASRNLEIGFETFPEFPCITGVTGAPILDGAVAHFDCTVAVEYDGGDHVIFVGNVVEAKAHDGDPLLYFKGNYRGVRDLPAA